MSRPLSERIADKLNTIQLRRLRPEPPEARLLDPIHAIQFAIQADEGIEFLRSWNQGDWQTCALYWPEWLTFNP
jgi:hypothetical protein